MELLVSLYLISNVGMLKDFIEVVIGVAVIAVYIAIKTTMNPTMTAMPMTTAMKSLSMPTLLMEYSETSESMV